MAGAKALVASGLTEAEASHTIGISRNTLSRVLAGLTVRKKTLALLRACFSKRG